MWRNILNNTNLFRFTACISIPSNIISPDGVLSDSQCKEVDVPDVKYDDNVKNDKKHDYNIVRLKDMKTTIYSPFLFRNFTFKEDNIEKIGDFKLEGR